MSHDAPATSYGLITVQASAITVFSKFASLTPEHEQRLIDQLVPEHAQHLIPINRRDNTLLELLFQQYNALLQATGADETRIAQPQDVKEVEYAYVITQDEPHFHLKLLAYLINDLWYDAATQPFPETLEGRVGVTPKQLRLIAKMHAFQQQISATRLPHIPRDNGDPNPAQPLEQRLNTVTCDILGLFHYLCKKLPGLPSWRHPTEPFPTRADLDHLLTHLPLARPSSRSVKLGGENWYEILALGLWRFTRGVYDLHPALLDRLWEATTPLDALPLLDPTPQIDPTLLELLAAHDLERQMDPYDQHGWLHILSLFPLFPFPKLPEQAIYIRIPDRFDVDDLLLYGVFVTFPPRGILLVLDGADGTETLLLDAQFGPLAAAIEHAAQVRRDQEGQAGYVALLQKIMNVVWYLRSEGAARPTRVRSVMTLEGSLEQGTVQETTFWEINPTLPEAGAPAEVNASPSFTRDAQNARLPQPGYFELLYPDSPSPEGEAAFQLRWHPPEESH